ncbi:MAG: hypothetical protein Q8P18_09150 [Pseudomonadota bacterium]|nr:hypothetical protein [Pseudomonadota bacterium]
MRRTRANPAAQLLAVLVMLLGMLVPGVAFAAKPPKESEGVPVRVIVLDAERAPISTAVIRHPLEADRHRVNSVDGSWEASVLYMPDGSELRFTPGMTLELEISAPGFMTQVFQYQVRKRKNVVELSLPKIEMDDTNIEEPVISFGRDLPREPTEAPP